MDIVQDQILNQHQHHKKQGLSQEELAQRMGYRSKSSITKLEKGINDLPQSKVEELAAALETTPAYLLGLDEQNRQSTERQREEK